MEFTSTTEAIPKGYRYIVKPSELVASLQGAGVEIDMQLVRGHSKILFDAWFWPPNPNVAHERLYIRVGTVVSQDLEKVRHQVETQALPRLVEWISGILSLDPQSPVRRDKQSIQLLASRA